jgi:hypothetical protein
MALVLGTLAGAVFAGAADPTYWDGVQNPTFPPCVALKIDPPVSGTYYFDGGVSITITTYNTDMGQEFDWSSTASFGHVFVKGGPGGNIYAYDPMVKSGAGLHAPLASSGKWAGLSHITFYYCFVATPAIDIEKATNGHDADSPTGPMIYVGDSVTWTYAVTNTGNVPLTQIAVTDSVAGVAPAYISGDDGDGIMEPGDVWYYAATGTAVAGQYANLGTVTGKYGPAVTVTDNDPSHYFGAAPAIDIEKHTNGQDADEPTGPMILVGQPVAWTYIVTNTGNVPLTNIQVVDDQGVVVTLPGTTLGVGESMTGTASGVAVAGQYANLGTVTGQWSGHPVTDADSSHYFGEERTPECFSQTAWAADGVAGSFRFTDNNWATYVTHIKGSQGVTEYDLYAGQTYLAGKIQVWEEDGYLKIKYVVEGTAYKPGWQGEWVKMTEAHVAVGAQVKNIPSNKAGPIPGRFAYKWTGESDTATVSIPLTKVPEGEFILAAHSVVWWCGYPADELAPMAQAAVTDSEAEDQAGESEGQVLVGLERASEKVAGKPGNAASVIETLITGGKPGKAIGPSHKAK